jgi:hypothetical protein
MNQLFPKQWDAPAPRIKKPDKIASAVPRNNSRIDKRTTDER